MTAKLWNYFRSSASWRVRIALHFKGIEFEYLPVNLLKGDQHGEAYRAINPLQAVPTLEIDGLHLSESMAIVEYLEETRPTPSLMPKSPADRARARRIAEAINAGIQPLQNPRVLRRLETELHADSDARKAWAAHFNRVGLAALEALVSESASSCSVGDEVSVADLCLVPQLFSARRFGIDVAEFPTLARLEAGLAQRPAFVRAHATNQPDCPPEAK